VGAPCSDHVAFAVSSALLPALSAGAVTDHEVLELAPGAREAAVVGDVARADQPLGTFSCCEAFVGVSVAEVFWNVVTTLEVSPAVGRSPAMVWTPSNRLARPGLRRVIW